MGDGAGKSRYTRMISLWVAHSFQPPAAVIEPIGWRRPCRNDVATRAGKS